MNDEGRAGAKSMPRAIRTVSRDSTTHKFYELRKLEDISGAKGRSAKYGNQTLRLFVDLCTLCDITPNKDECDLKLRGMPDYLDGHAPPFGDSLPR